MEEYNEAESKSEFIEKDDVVAAFKPLADGNISNPDKLDAKDAKVLAANQTLTSWTTQEISKIVANGAKEAEYKFNLARTMIMVDAGFKNKEYLEKISKLLGEDLKKIEKGGEKFPIIEQDIKSAISRIQNIIKESDAYLRS